MEQSDIFHCLSEKVQELICTTEIDYQTKLSQEYSQNLGEKKRI